MARDISDQLARALKTVDRPGTFCADGSGPAPLPGLEVAGVGPVGLPLTAAQAPDPGLRDLRLIRYADDFVVLARSRRQLEQVVLPKLREFLAARGLRLSDEKTKIVRDTEGFDFVGRQFKRLSPTKFLVRPRRRSVRAHRDALLALFRNRAISVGQQIQRANAIIRGFCNHFRTDHSGRTFMRLTYWTLRSFCKWVARRGGRVTAGRAYHRLTRVSRSSACPAR